MILHRYINKHNEKSVEYTVQGVLKLLTTANRVRYIQPNPKSNLECSFNLSEILYCLEIIKIDIILYDI